jgi:CheY-like chemotaxis protein
MEKAKAQHRAKILYVEDELLELQERATMLRDKGYIVDLAQDGSEALALLHTKQYDLVLLDIRMGPGEDLTENTEDGYQTGVAVLRRMREQLKLDVPVIVLTAFGRPDIESRMRLLGVKEFLGKPISQDLLEEYIAKHIG